jgi:hypothetical protein
VRRSHQVCSYGRDVTAHHLTPSEREPDRSALEPHQPPRYEIRVVGHLGARWAAWFDGLEITNEPAGTCLIRGAVVDQAALHGLLNKVRDIGLPLQSLTQICTDGSATAASVELDPHTHTTPGAPS